MFEDCHFSVTERGGGESLGLSLNDGLGEYYLTDKISLTMELI